MVILVACPKLGGAPGFVDEVGSVVGILLLAPRRLKLRGNSDRVLAVGCLAWNPPESGRMHSFLNLKVNSVQMQQTSYKSIVCGAGGGGSPARRGHGSPLGGPRTKSYTG